MDLKLEDKIVLVTGASGGIGRATVRAFAREGAHVVAQVHRNRAAFEDWNGEPWRDRVSLVHADVRDADACTAMFREATVRHGRVDICIVNAGVWAGESIPLADMAEARVRDVLDVNLFGAIWTARAFLAELGKQGPDPTDGASLTFIGSTSARFGEAGNAEYAASKAALYGLVRTLKNEMPRIDPRGRVNLVEPGWTRTAMTEDALSEDASVERAVRTMPLRQVADPEDIAHTVLWLSSPVTARHITGEFVTVAGGMEGRQLWAADEVDAAAIRNARGPVDDDGG